MTQSKSWIKNSKLFYMHVALLSRWYGPPEVDLNDTHGSVTHIAAIFKFRDVSGPRAKKMTQSKSQIKGSKGSIGDYPPQIYYHIF